MKKEATAEVPRQNDDEPHVAVLASPGLGHIIPLLELSKRLIIDHGLRVTFLVITIIDQPMPAQDQLLRSPSLPSELRVLELPPVEASTVVPEGSLILTSICHLVEASLKTLKSTLIDLDFPEALIIDQFCTKAFEVCKELSIPTYSFFLMSATMLAFSLYLPILDCDVPGEFVDLPEPVQVPGCMPIHPEDLIDQVKNRKSEEYTWFLLHVSRLRLAAGILSNSWECLEPSPIKAMREEPTYVQMPIPPLHAIGPLVREEADDVEMLSKTEVQCLAWLDEQKAESVVLVSLGSGGTLTSEQLVEMAWGLELSRQRFIWIVRKPSDASASGAFFNVGSETKDDPTAYLPQGFLERTRDFGVVVPSWADQVTILRHPSVGAFLSHCGWNSSLESMSNGVPMIAWPLYAEQRTNAALLAEHVDVAVRPTFEEGKRAVGRREIERVVRMVIEGEEGKAMRRKARELQESSTKALSRGGSSHASLAALCENWRSMFKEKRKMRTPESSLHVVMLH